MRTIYLSRSFTHYVKLSNKQFNVKSDNSDNKATYYNGLSKDGYVVGHRSRVLDVSPQRDESYFARISKICVNYNNKLMGISKKQPKQITKRKNTTKTVIIDGIKYTIIKKVSIV